MSHMHKIARIALNLVIAGVSLAETKREAVDKVFAHFNTHTPGCSVGVAQEGKVVFTAGYGMADLERGVPVTASTIFESGSVAKQFTAATLMLLAQDGVISLDDRLSKYLPELQGAPATVTVRQVISHISGLREWRPVATFSGRREDDTVVSNEDLLEMAAKQKALNFDPGSQYSYSNTGYNISTILVERALQKKKTFQQYSDEKIFAPLGMSSTRWRDNFRAIVPGRALAYRGITGGFEQLTPIGNIIGAGGLLTTVEDLLKWNENFVTQKVGGAEFVAQQQKPAVLSGGKTITYAAGLMVSQVDGLREVSHSGATGGYRTWLGRYPDQHVSVAVLCNTTTAATIPMGRRVARLWTGATETPRPTAIQISAAKLGAMQGMYRSLRNNTITELSVREGKLFSGQTEWVPVGENEFAIGATRIVVSGPTYRVIGADGEEGYEKVRPVQPDAAKLGEYIGDYTSDELTAVTKVFVEGGVLRMKVVGTTYAIALTPTFSDAFRSDEGSVVFLREGSTVNGLRIGDGRVWDMRLKKVAK